MVSKCCKCKKYKDVSCFSSNVYGRNHSLSYTCRKCKSEYNKNWYKKHRQQQINRAKRRNAVIESANRKLIDDYLSLHPCVDCGETDIIVLEFDHVRGQKEYNIARMISFNPSHIIEEIKKCEVRCANCHRRKTYRDICLHSVKDNTSKS